MILETLKLEKFLQKDRITIRQYYYLFEYIKNLSDLKNLPKSNLEKINLTNNELIEMTHDFYKNYTTEYFYEAFLKSYQNTKLKIKPISKKKYYGHFNFNNITKSGEIELIRHNNFYDIIALAHEYAHGMQYVISTRYMYHNTYLFDEVFSTFFELLSALYHELDELNNKSINYQIDLFNTCNKASKYTMEEIKFLTNFQDYKIKEKEILNEAKNFFTTNPLNDIQYTTAFIIATNLLQIYVTDPEYAFYLLRMISTYEEPKTTKEKFEEIKNLGLLEIEPIKDYQSSLIRKRN